MSEPLQQAVARIQQDVDANDVVLFMKGTPNFPQCGFSAQVVKLPDYSKCLTRG
jgi:monothiol glutaredoxin